MRDLNKIINEQRERIAELEKRAEAAEKRVKELEKDVLEEIENRDVFEEWLDKLSNEVARYFGVDIGEHSSANNPWLESFEAIPEDTLSKFAIEQQIKALEKFEHISVAVANHWCDKEQAGYLWFHSEVISELKRLRQKLNTSDH